jgi:hypothetical protein
MNSIKISFKENIKKHNKFPQSSYKYCVTLINNNRVGVVVDKDEDGFMSVTNNIENIANELKVNKIIYKNSDGTFDYWELNLGYRALVKKGEFTKNLRDAIMCAKNSYLRKDMK